MAAGVAATLMLTVAPTARSTEPTDSLDAIADDLDAARCDAWSQVPNSGDCPLGPEAEYRCALWGETTWVEPDAGGLRYTLAGEVVCRQDGRTLRTFRGTFRTGSGLVTRTCQSTWCDRRGVPYDVYASTEYRARCVYDVTGLAGTSQAGGTLYERSARPNAGNQLLSVDLPEEHARFRVDDFSVANGDGVGVSLAEPLAVTNVWALDDGDAGNGWSEGALALHVTMKRAAGTADGPLNCLPTDQLRGFTVEGTIDFAVNGRSIFR